MIPADTFWLFLVKMQPQPSTSWLLTLPPCRSASGIIYPSKNYLKWRAIQLAIHSIVGAQIKYKQLQNIGEFYASICFHSRDTRLQIITIGNSKYLQLCIEGGFSLIQSHMYPILCICAYKYVRKVASMHNYNYLEIPSLSIIPQEGKQILACNSPQLCSYSQCIY